MPPALATPTMSPASLMSRANVRGRVGRPGSGSMPPAVVNTKARVPFGPMDHPTTSPFALMPQATLLLSPGNTPKSSTT